MLAAVATAYAWDRQATANEATTAAATAQGEVAVAQAELKVAKDALAEAESEIERKEDELVGAQDELDRILAAGGVASRALEAAIQEADDAKAALKDAEADLMTAQGDLAAAQGDLTETQDQLEAKQTELEATQSNLKDAVALLGETTDETSRARALVDRLCEELDLLGVSRLTDEEAASYRDICQDLFILLPFVPITERFDPTTLLDLDPNLFLEP